ncbi:MAG: penicillin-binding protein 2 [Hyphomonadaceae bacterium]
MNDPKRDAMTIFTRRAALMMGGVGIGAGVIAGRLVWLQGEDLVLKEYTAAADSNRFDLHPIVPARGIIYDRFGEALALSSKDYRVSIVPEATEDLAGVIRALGELLEMPPEAVERRIRDAKNRRPWDEVPIKNGLTWPQFATVNVRLPELRGVKAVAGEQRYYPFKSAFAHPLGYVQKPNQREIDRVEAEDRKAAGLPPKAEANEKFDSPRARYFRNPDVRIGKAGLEAALETRLQGEPGWRQVEVNAMGRVVNEVAGIAKAAKQGAPAVLTIDAELQRAAMEMLGDQSGCAVVMDVENGDLIVMASAPGFDPNAFVNGISPAEFAELNESDHKPLFHKAVTGAYNPGSTFKVASALAVLEAGVDPKDRVTCPGYYWFGGRRFHCWQKHGHGSVDLRGGIKGSCDVYFYIMAQRAGQQALADTARKLGLGQKYDVDVPNISTGIVPDPAWWAKRRPRERMPAGMVLNTAIGQGDLLASPLQLAVMAARLSNGGRAITPRLLLDKPALSAPAQLSFSKDHLDRVTDAMIAISNEPGGTALRSGDMGLVRDPATGKAIDAAGAPPGLERVRMGGKTGTAQVRVYSAAERAAGLRSNNQLPWHLRDNALFICFAPADKPRYVCAVVIEHGGSGSAVAAPIARDIMRATLLRDPASMKAMKVARGEAPAPPGAQEKAG